MPEGSGIVDDLFLHELCLELHKTRKEIGEQMTAHELTVQWPLFYAYRERERKRQEERDKHRGPFQR